MERKPENSAVTPGCTFKLSDDLKNVFITFTFPDRAPAGVQLDAQGVDNLLENLGRYRQALKPEVTGSLERGMGITAVQSPKWFVEPERLNGGSILHMRDPRFGWLHYVLPLAMTKALGGFLQNEAAAQPLLAEKDKAN